MHRRLAIAGKATDTNQHLCNSLGRVLYKQLEAAQWHWCLQRRLLSNRHSDAACSATIPLNSITLGLLSLVGAWFDSMHVAACTHLQKSCNIVPGTVLLQETWRGEIEQLSWKPRAFVVHNFLSDEECDHLIKLVSCVASAKPCMWDPRMESRGVPSNHHHSSSSSGSQ